ANNNLNIESINRLSGRVRLTDEEPTKDSRACLEISVRREPKNTADLRAYFLELARRRHLHIAYQKHNASRRHRQLVVSDMDSTLMRSEVIDERATEAGVGEQVSGITESAMRGDIDFDERFRQRVAVLKGLDEAALERVLERLELSEGAER